jgi:hypothetical protein
MMLMFLITFITVLELSNLIPIKKEWLDRFPPDEDER